jgi:hypothetical protein
MLKGFDLSYELFIMFSWIILGTFVFPLVYKIVKANYDGSVAIGYITGTKTLGNWFDYVRGFNIALAILWILILIHHLIG